MGITTGGTIPHDIVGISHFGTGNTYDLVGFTAANTLGILTPSSTVGNNTIPIGAADGSLIWQGQQTYQAQINTSDVLPRSAYTYDLGAINKKYLQLHVAEMWGSNLVVVDTMATIGGRIIIAPSTTLTRDLTNVATTIYVKHNNLANGDRIYLESNGFVEWLSVDSAATLQAEGDYAYTVTRNLDGSGANAWSAGDGITTTGTTGDGFIDLYSVRGIADVSDVGPTIAGFVRNSAVYSDYSEVFALGNLNGLYGYGVDTYGMAVGKYIADQPWISVDATNGIKINRGIAGVVLGQWDILGNIIVGQVGAGQDNVYITAGEIQLRTNTTAHITLSNTGVITVGRVGAGLSNVYIDSGEIRLRTNITTNLLLDTNGYITVGALGAGLRNIYIDGANFKLRTNLTDELTITAAGIQVGQVGAGLSNVLITTGEIRLRNNTANMIVLDAAGNITVGQVGIGLPNIYIDTNSIELRINATPQVTLDTATPYVAVGLLTGPHTYISATDVQLRNGAAIRVSLASDSSGYIGDPATPALSWDVSGNMTVAGVLSIGAAGGFYQGTGTFAAPTTGLKIYNSAGVGLLEMWGSGTKQVYFDSTGSLTAGAGNVFLDSNGISITQGSATANSIHWVSGVVTKGYVLTSVTGNLSFTRVAAQSNNAAHDTTVVLTCDPGGSLLTPSQITLSHYGSLASYTCEVSLNNASCFIVNPTYTEITNGALKIGALSTAASGSLRMKNAEWIAVRNAADSADINMFKVNASNLIEAGTSIIIPNGSYIGQVAGPMIVFDDTANELEITGCTVTIGTTPASAGLIRIPNAQWIAARNAANSADINMWQVNASNRIQAGTEVYLPNALGIGVASPVTMLHGSTSTIIGTDTSNVAGASLGASETNIYLDEATHRLYFYSKYSDGVTLKTGYVQLA